MTDYIFGYGSLILKESRNRTGISGEVFPVRVRGYQREWNQQVGGETYLGITKNLESKCNGVLFEIPEGEIEKFDEREIGYTRVKIPLEKIESLKDKNLPKGNYWIYLPVQDKSLVRPTKKFPIVQSYIDVILTGCLQISKDFAKEFMKTTFKWNCIENDRANPKYPRALKELKFKYEIDKLMEGLK